MDVTGFGFSNLRFWAEKDSKRRTMSMSTNNSFGNEFWNTLGRKSSDSKTHWLCFASQKCCELHFKFNEKFKEVAAIFPVPNELKPQFFSSFVSTSIHPSHLDFLWFTGVHEMFSNKIARVDQRGVNRFQNNYGISQSGWVGKGRSPKTRKSLGMEERRVSRFLKNDHGRICANDLIMISPG